VTNYHPHPRQPTGKCARCVAWLVGVMTAVKVQQPRSVSSQFRHKLPAYPGTVFDAVNMWVSLIACMYLKPTTQSRRISADNWRESLLCVSSRCKGKGKGLDTCYSATYTSQTRDQQRFTISEVAADWHEPMVPKRIMWPSIARANEQLDPRCS